MAIEITIPRLGWSMEEGTFSDWLKKPGEQVTAGEPLFSVESDKVTMDIESLDSGVLHLPADSPQPGDAVKVGQLIGYLLATGEEAPAAQSRAVESLHEQAPVQQAPLEDSPTEQAHPGQSPVEVPVTPRARRVASELGVDLSKLQGSGKGGRIREQDARAAAAQANTPQQIPVTALRRTIAERMVQSRDQTVPVTLTRRADASRLTALRNRWKLRLQPEPPPAIHDIVAKLVAIALSEHKSLGGRWQGDHIALPTSIDIGIAVDAEHGLMVPVIRDVATKTLPEVSQQSRKLIDAARKREVQASDMKDGVFTISNLGGFGIEAFTPILNYPETAVLGLGAIRWEPVVLDSGQIVAREQMMLSLTFDHRVVDGGPAARFLQAIAALIEEPPAAVHCA